MKEYCRRVLRYDVRVREGIAKVMWMLGNYDISSSDIEEVFIGSINYDLILERTGNAIRELSTARQNRLTIDKKVL